MNPSSGEPGAPTIRGEVVTGHPVDAAAGWRVTAGAHIVMAVTFGALYSFAPMFPDLATEFGASRAQIATVFSIAACTVYAVGAVVGRMADRSSPRRLVLLGVVVMCLGFAAASQLDSLLALYPVYGLASGIGVGLSYVPALGAVQSWFVRRRGLASGLAVAGLGVGTLVLPLVTSAVLPQIGWRGAFLMLAVLVGVLGGIGALIVRQRPTAVNRSASARAAARAAAAPPLTVREAWRLPGFPLFYLVILLGSFCVFIPYGHLVPAAQDLGLSLSAGTSLIALIGLGSVVGRFVLAGLGDVVEPRILLALLTALVAASFLFWPLATGFWSLAAFATVFGAAYGGCVGLFPVVAVQLFGVDRISTMLGYLYTSVGVAALFGPSLAGLAFDLSHSYLVPILGSACAATVAAILTLRLRTQAGVTHMEGESTR